MAVNCVAPRESAVVLGSQEGGSTVKRICGRTVLLTNCIPPYSLQVLQHLAASVENLRVFVSTPMEKGRPWEPVWDGIDVAVQRSFAIRHRRVYKEGFAMTGCRHFPYDSLLLLVRYRPAVIVSAQLGFRTIQALVYRRLNRSSRLIIWADLSEHTEREIGPVQTKIRSLLLRAADGILVNGASGARYVQRLGVPSRRIVQAPYTTDLTPFKSIPLVRDPFVARRLLYVGQLVESKGLKIFLDALVSWAGAHPDQSCEMWFVGDGPMRKSLERFPLPARIGLKFFGNVPYSAMSNYLAQAGILVLPTLSDTWGVVVNEALAAGLPVLGSLYSQAVQELIQNEVNGWTFHADHPDELQDALCRALSASPPALAKMYEAARSSVAHLTPEYVAGRFVQAIGMAMGL